MDIKLLIKEIFERKKSISKINFLETTNPFSEKEKENLKILTTLLEKLGYQIERKYFSFKKDDIIENKQIQEITNRIVHLATYSKKLDFWYIETKTKPTSSYLRYLARSFETSSVGSFYNIFILSWNEVELLFVLPIRKESKIELRKLFVTKNNLYRTDLEVLANLNLERKDFTDLEVYKLWQEAFNKEKVSKAFYKEIQDLFYKLVGGKILRGNKLVEYEEKLKLPSMTDHRAKQIFAMRMIGRLIFCWFLKKKKIGNISLIPDSLLSLKAVLRFKDYFPELADTNSYYHSILERLFFLILNTPIEKRHQKVRTEKLDKIPFLNGGLFEPHTGVEGDYFKLNELGMSENINTLIVPDEWMRELFEVFEKYNFTIEEDTPLDIDLSIDPEMLGKVFENLLAEIVPESQETARKLTGSYYTPREIVDYMVEESLKEYLEEKTNLEKEKIDKLFQLDSEIKLSGEEKNKLVKAFDELKIIDPAVGSGAYPMGILQKSIQVLEKIDPNCEKWLEVRLSKVDYLLRDYLKELIKTEKVQYIRKLWFIENSIYGVDIQSIATDISKLRFFLTLIVDARIDPKKENLSIRPLPNFDFKFVSANSLIKISQRSEILSRINKTKDQLILGEDFSLLGKLKELRKQYFESFGDDKERIKKEYLALQDKLFSQNLLDFKTEIAQIGSWNPFSYETAHWFDPFWMFGIDDGFDIVIANPPYVRQEKIKDQKEDLKKQGYKTFDSIADLYVYFYERGFELLREKGILCYISSNKFLRARYGEKLRKFLKKEGKILKIINFGGVKVFDATVDTLILQIKKQKAEENWRVEFVNLKNDYKKGNLSDYFLNKKQLILQKDLNDNAWTLENERVLALKKKIESIGTPLKDWDVNIYFGIKTGFNNAFIIDSKKRKEILNNCNDEEERKRTEEIIKPILRGRDIFRWGYKWKQLWVIFTRRAINIEKYPTIEKYLSQFKDKLEPGKGRKPGPYKWYEIQDNIAFYHEFEKEKIVWQEIVREPSFAYDTNKYYGEATTFIMTGENLKYLIAILNSKPATFFFRTFYAGGGLGEGGYRYKKHFLESLHIPKVSQDEQKPFVELVDKILELTISADYLENKEKQERVREYEKEIDEMVYGLYRLTNEEINLIKTSYGG